MKNSLLITKHYKERHDEPKKEDTLVKIEYLNTGSSSRAAICGKKLSNLLKIAKHLLSNLYVRRSWLTCNGSEECV